MMIMSLASEGWELGTKETWNKNILSRQQRAHTAVPQLGQVGGSSPRLPIRVMQPRLNHINSAIGREERVLEFSGSEKAPLNLLSSCMSHGRATMSSFLTVVFD